MTIETKYNIGDEVWFLHQNKAVLGKIEQISTLYREEYAKPYEEYYLFNDWYGIELLYPTKEELLKSL